MIINGLILKEKNISVNQYVPAPKMHISMNRLNMMPLTPNEKNLQCELKLNISIEDEVNKSNVLANITLSYIVLAVLEDGDNDYEQDKYANRLFAALQPMYISEANKLMRESPFPPIPMNIKC
ncbi:MAG: hypothetical protein K6F15_01885 [Treponema sp.]|nr:hypothetical protein [Treponema sp.]